MNHIEEYRKKRPGSEKWFERAKKVFSGGVCHNYRFYPPFPSVMRKAEGCRMWDIDGNEYIDLWMGHYALILGHNSPVVASRARAMAEGYMHWGTVNELELQFGELIQKAVPSAEKVRFCVTGTEATMYAVRLARAFTGREKIVKAPGGWHGANTDLAYGIRSAAGEPDSAGLPSQGKDNILMLPVHDEEATLDMFDKRGSEIAAVIIEPVIAGVGQMPVDVSYLKLLRKLTRDSGSLLIFDEIITGFRLSLGGAQKRFNIIPDLTTMGKVAGGGTALGLIAGRGDIMDMGDKTMPDPERKKALIGGGTFSCSPFNMALGLAVVEHLMKNEGEIYSYLDEKGEKLRQGLREAFRKTGIRVEVYGIASLCGLVFPSHTLKPRSPQDVLNYCDHKLVDVEYKIRMMNKGIFVMHGGGALSVAHTDREIDLIIQAAEETAQDMAREGSLG